MNKLFSFVLLVFLASCAGKAQDSSKEQIKYKITKTTAQWKKELTSQQYYVLRQAGTERPFSSPLNKNINTGTYICAACKTPLYASKDKFDSGTGWPSFDQAIKENVILDTDYKTGYARTELKCNTCGGHLGHSFNDGPKNTTGKRHCINGAALTFSPANK